MWVEFVVGSLHCSDSEVFLRVLRFSPLLRNQDFQIPFRPGIMQTKNHFVDVLTLIIRKIFRYLASDCSPTVLDSPLLQESLKSKAITRILRIKLVLLIFTEKVNFLENFFCNPFYFYLLAYFFYFYVTQKFELFSASYMKILLTDETQRAKYISRILKLLEHFYFYLLHFLYVRRM